MYRYFVNFLYKNAEGRDNLLRRHLTGYVAHAAMSMWGEVEVRLILVLTCEVDVACL